MDFLIFIGEFMMWVFRMEETRGTRLYLCTWTSLYLCTWTNLNLCTWVSLNLFTWASINLWIRTNL